MKLAQVYSITSYMRQYSIINKILRTRASYLLQKLVSTGKFLENLDTNVHRVGSEHEIFHK